MGIPRSQLPEHVRARIAADEREAVSVNRRQRGRQARDTGQAFEDRIEATFAGYRARGIAHLALMPVPTSPCGVRHPKTKQPLRILAAPAPFDVYGWSIDDGRFIGAELKYTSKATSLRIIGPDGKGAGLQWHQLQALVDLADAGGHARVVWQNGGEVGVVGPTALTEAHVAYRRAREGVGGRKSIPWDWAVPIEPDADGFLDWLGGDGTWRM